MTSNEFKSRENLVLNNLQWLICHKTKPNQTKSLKPAHVLFQTINTNTLQKFVFLASFAKKRD